MLAGWQFRPPHLPHSQENLVCIQASLHACMLVCIRASRAKPCALAHISAIHGQLTSAVALAAGLPTQSEPNTEVGPVQIFKGLNIYIYIIYMHILYIYFFRAHEHSYLTRCSSTEEHSAYRALFGSGIRPWGLHARDRYLRAYRPVLVF